VITLTQLADSLAPMQFAIAAIDEDGNTVDPTSFPAEVTFAAITSPPTPFNPGTATWTAASWSVQPGNPGPVYWLNVLPGPGGVAVAAGSYIAYAKITASPALPILPCVYAVFT
jgi:hypothetical protein